MIDLKQYIEESLLDDFDTLASNQDKMLEHPWGIFWRDTENGGNWEGAVKQLENIITLGAKKANSGQNLKKGEVFVAFYISNTSVYDKLTRIHVKYNRKDFEVLWKKAEKRGAIIDKHRKSVTSINIMRLAKLNNRPHISLMEDPTTDNCEGYILSKEQAAKAIDMINKVADEEWATYWKSL